MYEVYFELTTRDVEILVGSAYLQFPRTSRAICLGRPLDLNLEHRRLLLCLLTWFVFILPPLVVSDLGDSTTMPKLYFRHGVVSSAKTLNLLAVAHNYKQQGKKIILLKPEIDVRFGSNTIKSKAGLEEKADYVIKPVIIL